MIGLKLLLNQARAQADLEAKSRIIISAKNTLASAVISAISEQYMSQLTSGAANKEQHHVDTKAALERYRELNDAVIPGSPQAAIVKRIGLKLILATRIMDSVDFSKKRSMDFLQLTDMLAKRKKLETVINSVIKDSDELAEVERNSLKRSPISYSGFRHVVDAVLLVGVMLNLLLAGALMIFFGRGITSRLAVLVDNSRRLLGEQELNPIVPGTDEIAQLDRVFHNTAAKLSEARARERAVLKRLKTIFETIPLGLIVTDEHGLIVSASPGAERIFGCDSATLENQPITRIFSFPEGIDRAQAMQELVSQEENSARELTGQRQDSSTFPCEILSTAYHSADLDGRLFVITDATEKHEIERMKQSFITMVSHELRSPLTSIQLCLEMLLAGKLGQLNEMGVNSVKMAERNTRRLISLVNEILDVERLVSGTIAVDPKVVSLASILDLSEGSVTGAAETAEIKIVSSAPDIELVADQDRIVQVLVNFLSNAIKFSPKGSTIAMSGEVQGNDVLLQVRDQGRGIPPDQILLVFERFHQVKSSDSTEKGGAGLGLAICKAIVEAHGGEIGASSEVGSGSTFWLRIPKNGKQSDVNSISIAPEVEAMS
jgi:PAS domain S-box-containing protein